MSPRWRKQAARLHLTVILALVVTLLSACGTVNVEATYPLESVSKDGGQTSYVYRAAGVAVPEAAKELAEQQKPQQMSKEDPDHMFLVYSDQIIHVQKDEQNPADSLIEVDSEEYVRQNYSPSFLEGYLVAALVGSLFDSIPSGGYGSYKGYGSLNTNPPAKGAYRVPTAADTQAAPPMTVQKKGSIFKRTTSGDDGGVGSGGLFNKKKSTTSPGTTGSITRDGSGSSGSSKSSGWLTPRKSTVPRTKVGGFGRVSRRR
ncbi:DUF4247 domain-containing protein [Cohnella lubricantis]|uniref:DUF4247 domain-containing protein n=1 Tax=Cohnella lubricantis TaxID=2163172 RepID=A0A841T612_9BACL|nr:DUF4247 domain-containing protein [Cohnella lubricantis]MBB6676754.1 DUF4247 domain-containing protein [Cohnella lubricantis]MBP2117800.1 hypothetical protein [Cohnella lubricantis]